MRRYHSPDMIVWNVAGEFHHTEMRRTAMLDVDGAIKARAYEIWQAEGQVPGRDLDYWLRAEAEITSALSPVEKRPRPAARNTTKVKSKSKARA
jgi:hypothetical protein